MNVLATPFHTRTAELNTANAWGSRGGFTAPSRFVGVEEEAMTARFAAVLFDTTPTDRLRIHGAGAGALLSAAAGQDVTTIKPGTARFVTWINAAGGVRSLGSVTRFGEDNFTMTGRDLDIAWLSAAAPRFGAQIRDETAEKGVLLLVGPVALQIAELAGLEAKLPPGHHAFVEWRGITVHVASAGALSRAIGGIAITCSPEDAPVVFDRLMTTGRPFGLRPGGGDAADLLHMEAGAVLIGVDVRGARSADDPYPTPAEIGLGDAEGETRKLTGLVWDEDVLASFAPLYQNGQRVGRTLRSAYSPALRRVIGYGNLPARLCAPGNIFTVRILHEGEFRDVTVHTVALPFVPYK